MIQFDKVTTYRNGVNMGTHSQFNPLGTANNALNGVGDVANIATASMGKSTNAIDGYKKESEKLYKYLESVEQSNISDIDERFKEFVVYTKTLKIEGTGFKIFLRVFIPLLTLVGFFLVTPFLLMHLKSSTRKKYEHMLENVHMIDTFIEKINSLSEEDLNNESKIFELNAEIENILQTMLTNKENRTIEIEKQQQTKDLIRTKIKWLFIMTPWSAFGIHKFVQKKYLMGLVYIILLCWGAVMLFMNEADYTIINNYLNLNLSSEEMMHWIRACYMSGVFLLFILIISDYIKLIFSSRQGLIRSKILNGVLIKEKSKIFTTLKIIIYTTLALTLVVQLSRFFILSGMAGS